MELSMFLAKVWGLGIALVVIALWPQRKEIRRLAEDLNHHPFTVMSGYIGIIIGVLMVTSHNVWIMGWPVIITLFGWMSLIKGYSRIAYPDFTAAVARKIVKSPNYFNFLFTIALILSIYLLSVGY